jgi:hypothetical protein
MGVHIVVGLDGNNILWTVTALADVRKELREHRERLI